MCWLSQNICVNWFEAKPETGEKNCWHWKRAVQVTVVTGSVLLAFYTRYWHVCSTYVQKGFYLEAHYIVSTEQIQKKKKARGEERHQIETKPCLYQYLYRWKQKMIMCPWQVRVTLWHAALFWLLFVVETDCLWSLDGQRPRHNSTWQAFDWPHSGHHMWLFHWTSNRWRCPVTNYQGNHILF